MIGVESDWRGFDEMLSAGNLGNIEIALAEAVANDSNNYVPKDTGHLHDSMQVDITSPTEATVEWPAEYAQYVYEGDHTVSPAYGGGKSYNKWFEHAKRKHGREWQQLVTDYLTGGDE